MQLDRLVLNLQVFLPFARANTAVLVIVAELSEIPDHHSFSLINKWTPRRSLHLDYPHRTRPVARIVVTPLKFLMLLAAATVVVDDRAVIMDFHRLVLRVLLLLLVLVLVLVFNRVERHGFEQERLVLAQVVMLVGRPVVRVAAAVLEGPWLPASKSYVAKASNAAAVRVIVIRAWIHH